MRIRSSNQRLLPEPTWAPGSQREPSRPGIGLVQRGALPVAASSVLDDDDEQPRQMISFLVSALSASRSSASFFAHHSSECGLAAEAAVAPPLGLTTVFAGLLARFSLAPALSATTAGSSSGKDARSGEGPRPSQATGDPVAGA